MPVAAMALPKRASFGLVPEHFATTQECLHPRLRVFAQAAASRPDQPASNLAVRASLSAAKSPALVAELGAATGARC